MDKAAARAKLLYDEIVKIKESAPCADCGVNYPACVMDFDHLENKEFNLGNGRYVSVDRLYAEIAKCEIVCSNCHRIRTHNRRM